MNRQEFEQIRDLPGKQIIGDIEFVECEGHMNVVRAKRIQIHNSAGMDLRLDISVNVQTDEVNFNVTLSGTGPICRLDVRSNVHPPAGRNHKHSLRTKDCPGHNLRHQVGDKREFENMTFRELFAEFCRLANINHSGLVNDPLSQEVEK